jgi:dipeptidyl aminopeptidase/acylaminoacyl peptidase
VTITPDALTELALPGSPSVAPGGGRAVAAVQSVDPATLRYTSRLWTFTPGRPPQPLTGAGPWSDTAPQYAPDGHRVAFLSDRDGTRRVWVAGDGEPRPLDGPDAQPAALAWLDDGRLLVLAERPAEHDDGAPVVIDWLRYKSDGAPGPLEPTSELWLLAPGAAPRLLHRCEERLRCLAVRGAAAYYAARPRHSDALHQADEIRRLDLESGSEQLVWRCPSAVQAVSVTSCGRVLALASGEPGHSVVAPRVWLADEGRPAFPDGCDLECERAIPSDCRPRTAPALLRTAGEEALFVATVGNEVALFAGAPGTQPRRVTPPGRSVVDFDADAAGGGTAVSLESATEPAELYLDGERVSAFNTAWAAAHRPVAPEEITVTAADGLDLPGLLYRSPTGGGALLVRVHGGPHMAFGNTFDLETQTHLAAGYHVLVPNIRGSAGRGTRFRSLVVGEWGRADHGDLMAFTDWAVDSGTADPARLYLAGGSYGGYLVNWTLTRTGRFRAAVSERSVSNLLSKYGTSDNGFTVNRHEFAGLDLFDDGARELWERSPLHHADAVVTPVLLIHGEKDQRCPIEQSEQLFTALRRTGTEAVLARFPDESHGFTASGRPDRRIARLRMITAWLGSHP